MNNVTLIGRLTKDPEIRWTDGGLAIAQFTLAIDRPPTKDGEKQTDFPRVKAFGKTAEVIERYVSKGQQIGISGNLQTGSYENREGQKIYTTEVVIRNLDLLSRSDGQNNTPNERNDNFGTEYPHREKSGANQKTERQTTWEQLDEDIPF